LRWYRAIQFEAWSCCILENKEITPSILKAIDAFAFTQVKSCDKAFFQQILMSNLSAAAMDTAQSAMKKEVFDVVVPAQLWFGDLPLHLSNLHPHSPANEGAFTNACEQACSDAELDVVG
jgi:hypothetical protein